MKPYISNLKSNDKEEEEKKSTSHIRNNKTIDLYQDLMNKDYIQVLSFLNTIKKRLESQVNYIETNQNHYINEQCSGYIGENKEFNDCVRKYDVGLCWVMNYYKQETYYEENTYKICLSSCYDLYDSPCDSIDHDDNMKLTKSDEYCYSYCMKNYIRSSFIIHSITGLILEELENKIRLKYSNI